MGHLTELAELILSSAKALEAVYDDAGKSVPTLDDLFCPSPLDSDPAVQTESMTIVAAANQIMHTVANPLTALQLAAGGLNLTTAWSIVQEANVPDILLEADAQKGLHVKDIASICGLEQDHLARLLRFLASRHFFKEVSPHVFANNRLSSFFLKHKSVSEIKADPQSRYDNAPLAGILGMMANDGLEVAPHLKDWVKSPQSAEAAFNIAKKTDQDYWAWLGAPGNEDRARQVATAMAGGAAHFPRENVTNAIDGANLKPGSIVVDVGGGQGGATMMLYKKYPHLKYIIQDLDNQADAAGAFWSSSEAADAWSKKQVQFQRHSFFDAQPVKNADVYLMRLCIHDWSDSKAKVMMSRIRDAAGPTSRFVVLDPLAMHTCQDPDLPENPIAPKPLLANYGIAGPGGVSAMSDIQMLYMYNGKERTVADMRLLGEQAGWKLQELKPGKLMAYIFSPA
ncbi:S-adenosyl-L-methionine-dependent methyltransferase [Cylindrobasidium torrendii FP15055 ss-10]|uniref:S-adenosyl-L-methionine-dependent methyltransferase n=1 Tax=Cylindrobasidium torrendii FP15055 ss-10 TaxID=1314674 RepID=A0A0D7B9S6_9AGAR|nr:S-adenosyl-L-methionine-dependent methyltransferase [Cylindrobasidium torrendii FP15055 ss-10]